VSERIPNRDGDSGSDPDGGAAYALLDLGEQANRALRGEPRPDDAPDQEALARELQSAGERVPDAVDWLLDHDPPAALRFVGVLARFWQDVGLVDLGRALTERALDSAAASPSVALARATSAAAELAFRQGDQAAAEAYATRAADVARSVGDRSTEALAYTDLARVALRRGDAEAIDRWARRAYDVPDAGPLARRGALHMLAWAAHAAGDLDEAERRFEASLAFRRELGDRFAIAVEIGNLADLAMERGDLAGAARRHAAVLTVARDLDNRYLLINELPSFAVLAARAGDLDAAARLLGATDAIAESAGLVPDPGTAASGEEELRRGMAAHEVIALRTAGASMRPGDAITLALAVARRLSGGVVEAPDARSETRPD
jgi:tetratricopeptide (TPR) repeat protein